MLKQLFVLGGEIEHNWKKDTLPLIAKLTGNTVDEIKKLNGLSSEKLSQNQKLKVLYNQHVLGIANLKSLMKNKALSSLN